MSQLTPVLIRLTAFEINKNKQQNVDKLARNLCSDLCVHYETSSLVAAICHRYLREGNGKKEREKQGTESFISGEKLVENRSRWTTERWGLRPCLRRHSSLLTTITKCDIQKTLTKKNHKNATLTGGNRLWTNIASRIVNYFLRSDDIKVFTHDQLRHMISITKRNFQKRKNNKHR